MPLPKEAEGKPDFEFEVEGEDQGKPLENSVKPDIDIEVQDDTPEEDRGRTPLPREIVEELDADELEEYSDKVKTRLKQMKKVWHDERRVKDEAIREREEAIRLAQMAIEENKALKAKVSSSQSVLISNYKQSAQRELEDAKRLYKDAYDAGDSERLVDAQEKLTDAKMKANQAERFTPALQEEESVVNSQQVPKPDNRAVAWQERNIWFGKNRLMTGMALALHEDLVEQHGQSYATTDEYYARIDKTMRQRFPIKTTNGGGKPVTRTDRPATVVAPASRSTSSKKIVLKQSQLMIAKKLGLTPEQYAREFAKTQEN